MSYMEGQDSSGQLAFTRHEAHKTSCLHIEVVVVVVVAHPICCLGTFLSLHLRPSLLIDAINRCYQ